MSGALYTAPWVWLPGGGLQKNGAVAVTEGGVVLSAGGGEQVRARFGYLAERPCEGVLFPGFVNAHTHLDLCWARDAVPGGDGLFAWIAALRALPPPGEDEQVQAARAALSSAMGQGTQVFVDVGGAFGAKVMQGEGAAGVALTEIMGTTPETARQRLRAAPPDVGVTPHAPYSLHPDLWGEVAARAGDLLSVHFAESPHEAAFWQRGEGPVLELFQSLGVESGWTPPGDPSPLALLRQRFAGPVLAVHATHGEDFPGGVGDALPVLCPRSAAFIADGCREPGAGPFALGTDSLASAPDLHTVHEAAALYQQFPHLDTVNLFLAMTEWPAWHLGWQDQVGAFVPGATPGLVSVQARGQTAAQVLESALTAPSQTLVAAQLVKKAPEVTRVP